MGGVLTLVGGGGIAPSFKNGATLSMKAGSLSNVGQGPTSPATWRIDNSMF